MAGHKVIPHNEWLAARKELLVKEKEFSRMRDELSQLRRNLPWEKVEKEYVFDGPRGRETLSQLFDGRSQLVIYHFMFDPEWNEGCKSCSFIADHYDPAIVHLNQRDVTMVTVSRAPLPKLDAFKKRMGWTFKWVSSYGTDFNWDTTSHLKPKTLPKNRSTTTIMFSHSPPQRDLVSVSSAKTNPARFFTPIHRSPAGSTCSSLLTTFWTSCRKVAMNRDSHTVWSGCATMIGTAIHPLSIPTCISWIRSDVA